MRIFVAALSALIFVTSEAQQERRIVAAIDEKEDVSHLLTIDESKLESALKKAGYRAVEGEHATWILQ